MNLSIIIPTLNEEKYLPILLDSLSNQTNKNFEVLVTDCHSEDKTVEKANSFKDKLNIRVVEAERKNVAHQRNAGAKAAKGDLLVFADADYKVKQDFVESCYKEFGKTKADLIIPFSYPITKNPLWTLYFYIQNYICILASLFGKSFGVASGNITRREAFEKMRGYNESVYAFEKAAEPTSMKVILTMQ